MFEYPTSMGKEIQNMIKEEMNKNQLFDIYIVSDVDETTFTVSIVHPTITTLQYENVPLLGTAFGNFKGLMCLPEVNDHVLVLFMGERAPVIIGSMYSQYDTKPAIKKEEMLLCPKTKGSYIFFDKNDNIKIKSGTMTLTIKDNVLTINGGTLGIARVGDSVSVSVPTHGTCTGTITSGSSKARCG